MEVYRRIITEGLHEGKFHVKSKNHCNSCIVDMDWNCISIILPRETFINKEWGILMDVDLSITPNLRDVEVDKCGCNAFFIVDKIYLKATRTINDIKYTCYYWKQFAHQKFPEVHSIVLDDKGNRSCINFGPLKKCGELKTISSSEELPYNIIGIHLK